VLAAVCLVAAGAAPAVGTTPAAGAATATASTAALSGADTDAAIYVIRRGWHVDLGFAAAGISLPLGSVRTDLPGARYVVFGFGDRRYLLARRKTVLRSIGALWPAPGLLLVTGLTASPESAFGAEHVIMLHVSGAEARAAADLVWRSMAIAGGAAAPVAPGPYPGSLFYGAVIDYSAINTCNTWVASILRSSGLPVRARGVLFAGQIWRQALRLTRDDAVAARAQRQGGVEPSEHTAVVP
jgi:hypothetical protein